MPQNLYQLMIIPSIRIYKHNVNTLQQLILKKNAHFWFHLSEPKLWFYTLNHLANITCGSSKSKQRMSAIFPIPNEYILLSGVLVLVVLIGWEYYDTQLLLSFENKQYAPVKRATDSEGQDEPLSLIKDESEVTSIDGNQSQTQSSVAADDDGSEQEAPIDLGSYRRFAERISVTESVTNKIVPTDTREAIEALTSKIMSPMLAGCEPFGSNANYMAEKFPNLTRADISRFLVARKGNVVAASDMAEKCIAWRASVFPVKKEDLRAAISTQCFFPFGNARDGTPCVYMRGGLYDNTKATPEQFVKAAAYAIEYSLKMNPTQINVTVIVDAWIIPGAPNLGADMTFIKLFVKVKKKSV